MQRFKSIYFLSSDNSKAGKSITISFSEKETNLFSIFTKKTNNELRTLVGDTYLESLIKNAEKENRNLSQYIKNQLLKNLDKFISGDVTFKSSKKKPLQRWFNYAEGFSTDFVKNIINKYFDNANNIYEPFAGTGTTIFACNSLMKSCCYSEVNPLMFFQIQTKIELLRLKNKKGFSSQIDNFLKLLDKMYSNAKIDEKLKSSYKSTFENSIYFSEYSFEFILKMKTIIRNIELENKLLADTLSMAIVSILLPISMLKKSGDVRFKTKKELENDKIIPMEILKKQLEIIKSDILFYDEDFKINSFPILFNSKKIRFTNDFYFDGIITSPPYLNGTNYIRNTKIELWFMEYIKSKDDLRFFRNEIITSGINDVIVSTDDEKKIVGISNLLDKTINELKQNAYDLRIPLMAEQYFSDMYVTFGGIKKHLKKGAHVAIDIGDSIFGGINIPTDLILIEILETLNFKLVESINLRERRSRSGKIIKQVLLIFKSINELKEEAEIKPIWYDNWNQFKKNIPYQQLPYSKRNWGNKLHSLCSYQGKLKPSIAHFLVNAFVPENGTMLDLFSGVGTIPFEARLDNKKAYGFDISLPAYYISSAKMGKVNIDKIYQKLQFLNEYISSNIIAEEIQKKYDNFGFNGYIKDYYEESTYKEILLARNFFLQNSPKETEDFFIVSALLHILHGNRPYALSRRSHPIIPYAPTGDFTYKNLMKHLYDKINKDISDCSSNIVGEIFLQDSTKFWPTKINNIDAIITSPPFFDSTRFYSANWIRLWFCGWEDNNFKNNPKEFIDERQKNSFSVYEPIFLQARERLKKDGVFVLHLGKSKKCNMADELIKISKKWFRKYDLFTEDVTHCEKFGIKDLGTVEKHQFLILN